MKILIIIGVIILVIIAAIKSTVRHKVGYVLFLVLFFSFANHAIYEIISDMLQNDPIIQKLYDPVLPIAIFSYSIIGIIEGIIRFFDDEFTFWELILDSFKSIWRKIYCKRIGVVFLKEESEDELKLENLTLKRLEAYDEDKWKVDQNLERISKGIYGENQVAFELKNSGEDMYVLHDILLTYKEQPSPAQIDYLVVTRKHVYVIEVKNWSGNIEVDKKGNFNHIVIDKNRLIQTGSEYSPITQNQRHLEAVIGLAKEGMKRKLRKKILGKPYYNAFKSLVVFSNARSYLDIDNAPAETKEQILKIDQLISYIRRNNFGIGRYWSNNEMYEIAKFYLDRNQTNRLDYFKKDDNENKQKDVDKVNFESAI